MIELAIECPICEGLMVVKISEERKIKELFEPCRACQVLANAS